VQTQATDLSTLLAALKADPEGAKQKYGHHEGQRPYNFLVKGEGKVLTVDTTSRSGTSKIDLLPEDGQPDATIQVGPVLRGTSLRDALPFIQFNQFTNQLEYADVSNQLNDRVIKETIGNLNVSGLQGKTVAFQGAFTLSDRGEVLITPVQLQVR
jgi:predicted lipoprotein